MGMVTLHLVIGVGVFILPLFLLLFSLVTLTLAHLYIVIGAVSFVASVLTTIVLVTKFVNQPYAHGFFSYSDTIASALMSLGLLLDGVLYLMPDNVTPCYQYKLVYGLFIVPIVTSFFSVLGMAIERFQTFALYRDRRKFTKKFSIAWFVASWTLALCFLAILLAQISEKLPLENSTTSMESSDRSQVTEPNVESVDNTSMEKEMDKKMFYIHILDMDLFPGPHSEKRLRSNLYSTPRRSESNQTERSSDFGRIGNVNYRGSRDTWMLMKTAKDALHNKESSTKNDLLKGVVHKRAVDEMDQLTGKSSTVMTTTTSTTTSLTELWPLVECVWRSRREATTRTSTLTTTTTTMMTSTTMMRLMTSRRNVIKIVKNFPEEPCEGMDLRDVLRLRAQHNDADDHEADDHVRETNMDSTKEETVDTDDVKNSLDNVAIDAVESGTTTSSHEGGSKGAQCRVSSRPFIMYYLILLFLLCFVTPALITTSLNVFIASAVSHTTYEVIAHHQWLTLFACILMWGPSLIERLLDTWGIIDAPLELSVFLFLLGHTHNLLRSVLHALFAQQIHSITWQGNNLELQPQRRRRKKIRKSNDDDDDDVENNEVKRKRRSGNKVNPHNNGIEEEMPENITTSDNMPMTSFNIETGQV